MHGDESGRADARGRIKSHPKEPARARFRGQRIEHGARPDAGADDPQRLLDPFRQFVLRHGRTIPTQSTHRVGRA